MSYSIDKLSDTQRALLEKELELLASEIPLASFPIIHRSLPNVTEPAPQQKMMVEIQQNFADSSLFNNPAYLVVKGDISVSTVNEIMTRFLQKHSAIVSRFVDGNVEFVPFNSELLQVKEVVCADYTSESPEFMQHLLEFASQSIDITLGAVQVAIFKSSSNESHIVFLLHHLVNDGFSGEILAQEFAILFEEVMQNRISSQENSLIDFKDYIHWYQQWLKGDSAQQKAAFWREYLKSAQLEVPLKKESSTCDVGSTYTQGGMVNCLLTDEFAAQIQKLAMQLRTTPFAVGLAAFNVLLAHRSKQQDIAIATPVAGRHADELRSLFGYFVNKVILRNKIRFEDSFSQLCKDHRQSVLDAFEHQETPYYDVYKLLGRQVEHCPWPLHNVEFTMGSISHKPVRETKKIADLEMLGWRQLLPKACEVDLGMGIFMLEDGLTVNLRYDQQIFNETSAHEFLQQFTRVFQLLIKYPHQSIAKIMDEETLYA